jgi:hypothetical protein
MLGALLGKVVLTWPGATVGFLARIIGCLLIITGVLQLSRPPRTLLALVGLLCLRTPLQTALLSSAFLPARAREVPRLSAPGSAPEPRVSPGERGAAEQR